MSAFTGRTVGVRFWQGMTELDQLLVVRKWYGMKYRDDSLREATGLREASFHQFELRLLNVIKVLPHFREHLCRFGWDSTTEPRLTIGILYREILVAIQGDIIDIAAHARKSVNRVQVVQIAGWDKPAEMFQIRRHNRSVNSSGLRREDHITVERFI